jgi:oxygen-independent coproporphyrinogen-3 oxidase
MGITAIGKVADTYSQNLKTLDEYYAALDGGRLPVYRGIELSADDRLRREIITRLICHFRLDFAVVEAAYGIVFRDVFAAELEALKTMQADGLMTIDERQIVVTPAGKLLIRNICMVFDRYLREQPAQRYSKVI